MGSGSFWRRRFGADRFGAGNKTGFKVEQNDNKWIQDPNPSPYPNLNPNRNFYQKFYFQRNMGLLKSGAKTTSPKSPIPPLQCYD